MPFIKVSLIIFLAYFLPVVLIIGNVIPFFYRFHFLLLMTFSLFGFSRCEQVQLKELGFTGQNLEDSIKNLFPVTVILAGLMILYYLIEGVRINNSALAWQFYLFFILISASAQEFLYRGYLFYLFSEVRLNWWTSVIISALLYSFVHMIYFDIPTLLLTFGVGVIWGINYAKYRNLYSVFLSHAILGTVAIAVGLI